MTLKELLSKSISDIELKKMSSEAKGFAETIGEKMLQWSMTGKPELNQARLIFLVQHTVDLLALLARSFRCPEDVWITYCKNAWDKCEKQSGEVQHKAQTLSNNSNKDLN